MHPFFPSPSPRFPLGRLVLPAALVLFLVSGSIPRARAQSHLQVPRGFHSQDVVNFSLGNFIGGLAVIPDGRLVVFDGLGVVLLGRDGVAERTLFIPDAPDGKLVFGNFIRLAPDGASVYFGENREGASLLPHNIYRVPLDSAPGEEVRLVDSIRLNYDLAFDGAGRGFVSALAGADNRIFLLDDDPEKSNDAVVVGIPGLSGPLAFHDGRLYYATARWGEQNSVVYFTPEQIEAGIGEDREIDFQAALDSGQVVYDGTTSYLNLLFAGERLFASSSAGSIDWIRLDGTVETFATVPLDNGTNGWVSYLAFRPGSKDFRSGIGPEGGVLMASISDFAVFNDLVEVRPELFFRRGYINSDAVADLSDAIAILGFLFLGDPAPDPLAACDVNDDGGIDMSDAIYLLSYLFTGGRVPPEPFEVEGADPTP